MELSLIYMEAKFKRQLMTYLDTGHRHESMSGMAACKYCGDRFKKGEALYNRMRREKPELFTGPKQEFQPSDKLREMHTLVVDRVNHDKLYRDHLWKSQYGTIEEQNKEADLANQGFYKKNSNYSKKVL